MANIAESVGLNCANKPVDVIKIQDLVNNNDLYTGLSFPLAVTGKVDNALVLAIKTFQSHHPDLKMKNPDGRVDVGGKTLTRLNQYNNKAKICRSYLPSGFSGNRFIRFDVVKFLDLYKLQYSVPRLGTGASQGLSGLVNTLVIDSEISELQWGAYMLATVKHECANTWQPIEEYGKGAGYEYGKVVKVPDPNDKTKKKFFSNVYYGRGYVQLTWENNYKKMDAALGLSGSSSLHLYPRNALEPLTAYRIMSHGMRNGSFTGKKLSDYIAKGTADYYNARRIINGLDRAGTIKSYADNIEFLLRFCNGI